VFAPDETTSRPRATSALSGSNWVPCFMSFIRPMNPHQTLFGQDSRGNRLMSFQATQKRDGTDIYLDLQCRRAIVTQIEWILRDLNVTSGKAPAPFTHRLIFRGPYTRDLVQALTLLQRVLTLRTAEGSAVETL